MADHKCDCLAQGPALLPVRYAVAPDFLPGSLPGWAVSGAQDYPPHDDYHYALRAMRRGFIYIYYPWLSAWEAWSISDDGSLWKQYSADNVTEKSVPDCKQGSYSQGGKDFITLKPDVLENDIWIAYSQAAWSASTLERYQSESARSKRMQCLHASQWLTPTAAPYAGTADESSISAVLDYLPASGGGAPSVLLPWGTRGNFQLSHMSNDGVYSLMGKVQPRETLYPWKPMRAGLAASTAQQMRSRGRKADGSPVTPVMMALHDAVGVAHELTGWTNDVLALPKIFGDERALEFSTQSLINGVEQIITKSAEQKVAERQAALWQDSAGGAELAWQLYVNNARSRSDAIMSREEFEARNRHNQQNVMNQTQVADDLAKYRRMLNRAKMDSFTACSDQLTTKVDSQVNSLMAFRVKWLENDHFIATSQDFYSILPVDNKAYREIVAFAISGLNIVASGRALLDEWINAYTTASEKNLVWRAHFYNNPEMMAEGEALLSQAMQSTAKPMTEAGLGEFFVTNASNINKLFEGFEGATSAIAKPPGADALFSAQVLYRVDQYMATVGARVFASTRLGATLDTVNDAVNRTLFSLAAGKTQAQIKAFLSAYFGWVSERSAYLDGLGFFKFNPANVRAQRGLESASRKFAKLDTSFTRFSQTEGKLEFRASSIKILVILFNVVELGNQLEHFKNEPGSYAKVTSAMLATTAGIADIAASSLAMVAKQGVGNGNWLFYLKMTGAGSSLVAAGISLGTDFNDLISQQGNYGQGKLFVYRSLYFVKVLNDVATLTSAEGKLMSALIDRFGWNTVRGTKGLWLGRLANPRLVFLGVEWVGMLSSWWVALGLMVAEYIITEYFSRDALQTWFENSVFGNDNSQNTDNMAPDKIAALVAEQRAALMNSLYTLSAPKVQKEPGDPVTYWPFMVHPATGSQDYLA
ncbi:T6SS effector BTH_I2691 family protein [Scandinavium sp. V105_16]|uniref:T6SS effector BTH_I2691 family protein n=1 Tax=Scandinavium lactucae TaxID=3095028 RepID=A0AAJ2S1A2_9ENTR|nr:MULTISPECIES: T6SS effector BTH_I2691 family protein [unclassified Scandinavium]MDX6018864.1 T6SS effector BTH_I2691 family protein [Scandinavium sp. V105_16]MDX6030174.1 T6SS effector BTH_I2691 family protein [Scandinavium sp. V105_12]